MIDTHDKARFILAGMKHQDAGNDAAHLVHLTYIIAQLTHISRDQREEGKRQVRDWMKEGIRLATAEQLAVELWNRHNRGEPD